MSFKEMVEQDAMNVFSNLNEFAEEQTIVYDGVTYKNVPCVITKLKEKDRTIPVSDHAQGLYNVTTTVHFPLVSLDGNVPENGCRISISDHTGFLHDFYVAQSSSAMGYVRLELEAVDE